MKVAILFVSLLTTMSVKAEDLVPRVRATRVDETDLCATFTRRFGRSMMQM
jgi:hypothetical protein